MRFIDLDRRFQLIDPEATEVKAVAEAGQALLDAHKAFKAVDRERTAAQGDPERLEAAARAAAKEAGREGRPVDVKKLRKPVAAAVEHLAEVELEWEAAASALRVQRRQYLDVIAHHAPALAAEAKSVAEASILSLASAASIARRAEGQMSSSLSLLGALAEVSRGGEFIPKQMRARKGAGDEFLQGSAPGPYVGEALDRLTKAVGFATRILDEIKAAEKQAALEAKLEAEADAAPDLDDDDDELEVE